MLWSATVTQSTTLERADMHIVPFFLGEIKYSNIERMVFLCLI